jgi:hypothetical protein
MGKTEGIVKKEQLLKNKKAAGKENFCAGNFLCDLSVPWLDSYHVFFDQADGVSPNVTAEHV